MAYENPMTYGEGTDSSIGANLITFAHQKKALIDLKKEQYFGQLADTTAMPKHYGKTIKQFHYLPLLDDRNINDQGIDAAGAVTANEVTILITTADNMVYYAVGNGVDAAAALTAAQATAVTIFKALGVFDTNYATTVAAVEGKDWTVTEGTALPGSGNLYGSSKDAGYITGKLPVLSETGGRKNRVGFSRVTVEGSIAKFGFFDEYTQESLDFDNEEDLLSHISRETLRGANEIVEDMLQMDLLNGAGIIMYGGDATTTAELTGESGATPSVLTYDNLVKMDIELTNNRCPKNTTMITGSRMTDTKTVEAARYIYVGSELRPTLLKMKDYHGNPAFVPVSQYGDAGNVATGEIGAIGAFRFIEVPEMMKFAGVGATVTNNGGYRETNGRYDVFPALVVGSGSFTTIGFQTNGKTVKFVITHKAPSAATADRADPYGETGFYSIKWYYGTLILRPERIGLIKVVA